MIEVKWLRDSFSIDEFKTSALVICLFLVIGLGCFFYYKNGDITDNWTTVITTTILTIGGVNAVSKGADIVTKKKANDQEKE